MINNNKYKFDFTRTLFNLITWGMLNFLTWAFISLMIALYFKVTNGISTNADVSWSSNAGLFFLIPLNWFYWNTKVKNGKWRKLFFRTW